MLLNFSRDQLDRNHEIKGLGRSWRDALTAAGDDGPVVVANADEPLIVWAAQTARRVVWVDTASTWTQDASLCPQCGSPLVREQPGGWRCTGCDLAQPPATYRVVGDTIVGPTGRWDARAERPRRLQRLQRRVRAGRGRAVRGRRRRRRCAGCGRSARRPAASAPPRSRAATARLLLAKNPAGWAEALPLATSDTVVLAIDSAAADGRDVSWLWDVEYEQLAGRSVVATGPRPRTWRSG